MIRFIRLSFFPGFAAIGDHLRPITSLASMIATAFKKRNQRRLRKLNDDVLRLTSQDCSQVNFNMAVFSYVLSKIVSKPRYLSVECGSAIKAMEKVLDRIVNRMDSATDEELLGLFDELEKSIGGLEQMDARFVTDLVTKGKMKMAATFYAQGISLGVSAEMTGLQKQEILEYAGETMMFDRLKEEKSIDERMKVARKLLTG